MQVAGDLDPLNRFFTPTHFPRDDLAVSAHAFRVALCVFVFDVDRCGERPDSVAIDRAQLIVQPSILFCALGHLFEQTMRVNTDADVTNHRANCFEVIL